MLYSSGTTGQPKGILPALTGQPFGTGLNIDHTMKNVFGFSPATVFLCTGPLYHGAPIGWSLGTIRNGGTAVVMERFDAVRALALIERYRVTHGQFVATMFVRMLKLPEAERSAFDISSLRLVVHSRRAGLGRGQGADDRLARADPDRVLRGQRGQRVLPDRQPRPGCATRARSASRSLGEVHICSDDGDELPAGEIGTVWFSGTRRFSYHNDPAKTAGVYNDKGWSTLGDMGSLDAEGYLYLADRRTDLILSGGVNIYPREIEDALALHPAVADIVVFGIPDEEMGQRVHAVVQPAVPGSGTPELAARADRLLPVADRALQGAARGLVRGRAAAAAVRQDAAPAAHGPLPIRF